MATRRSYEGNMVRRAGAHNALPDEDPIQSREWEQSVEQVIEQQGSQRAERLLHTAIAAGKEGGIDIDTTTQHPISIPSHQKCKEHIQAIWKWKSVFTQSTVGMR